MVVLNHRKQVKQVRKGVRASARISFLVFILSATLMAAAGCSLPAQSATPRPTPTVQQILAHAQNARLTDETFTFTMDDTFGPIPITANGTGKATSQPERIAVTMNMTIADETDQSDQVFDVATGDTYMKITAPPSLVTNRWEKNPDAAFLTVGDWQEVFPPYGELSDVTLIGNERLNGVAVWHIQGTFIDGNSTKISDIFVRQSDYLPVQQHLYATGSLLTIDMTYKYTAVNSGIAIDIPITTL